MEAIINISFETESELISHLSDIRRELQKAFKANPNLDNYEFENSNCYGDHYVTIKETEGV